MNCSRFKWELRARVEARSLLNTSDERLREHVANCPDPACRDAWRDACLLEQRIGEWAAGFPELNLGDRVVSELRSSAEVSATPAPAPSAPAVRARHRAAVESGGRNSTRWVVISAALLVLLSLVAVLTSPLPHRAGPEDVGAADSEPTQDSDIAPAAPQVAQDALEQYRSEAELSSAYLSFAEDATQFLTDTVALTLAGEEDIEDPTAAAEWIGRAEDRLEPWGEDFDAALDEFLRTIPDSDT